MGSGAFAVPVLEALLGQPTLEVVAVLAAPDRPAGRSGGLRAVPVAEHARACRLALLQPPRLRSAEAVAAFAALEPELGVLADYGQLVPSAMLDLPARGILNLHPSLLPRHRGATPIPAAILAGDIETGVSLFRMDAGLDSGPLIATERVALAGDETAPELEARLAGLAAGLLIRSIGPWLRAELEAYPQSGDGLSLSRPLRRADGRLDPERPAVLLERQVRAYAGWPGSYLETNLGRLVVRRASLPAPSTVPLAAGPGAGSGPPTQPGLIVSLGAGLALASAAGLFELDEVQLAGGRPMTGADLRRGHPGLIGSTVG